MVFAAGSFLLSFFFCHQRLLCYLLSWTYDLILTSFCQPNLDYDLTYSQSTTPGLIKLSFSFASYHHHLKNPGVNKSSGLLVSYFFKPCSLNLLWTLVSFVPGNTTVKPGLCGESDCNSVLQFICFSSSPKSNKTLLTSHRLHVP